MREILVVTSAYTNRYRLCGGGGVVRQSYVGWKMPSFLGGKSYRVFGQPAFVLAGNPMTILAIEKEVFYRSLSLFNFFSKSPKVFQIVLQYSGDLFCEKRSCFRLSIAWFFFLGGGGIKLNTCFTHEPSFLVLQCFHILSFNCRGLSNLLGLLAVCLNELRTALIYNNKI